MGNSQFEISKYVPEKLDVGRWMLDVRASARHGPVAQRLEQGTHNPLVPGSNPGGPSLRFGAKWKSGGCHAGLSRRGFCEGGSHRKRGANFVFDFRFWICDCWSCAATGPRSLRCSRDHDPERTRSGNAVRELSGRFRRRRYLFQRRRLLLADDARANLRRTSRAGRASSRFREFSARNNTAHNCAARLFNFLTIDFAEAIHSACNRFSRRSCFATSRAVRRLVSLVVVAANETPLSLGDAHSLWNQPDSRSWNGAGSAGSSILAHLARDNWRLR